MLFRVLLVVAGSALRRNLQKLLELSDVIVEVAGSGNEVWPRLANSNVDCIFIDRALLPRPVARSVEVLRQLPDSPAVVVLSEREDAKDRTRLLAAGCEAVLNSTLAAQALGDAIRTILDRIRRRGVRDYAQQRPTAQARLTDFVSHSTAMRAFMSVVYRVVDSDAPLLVQGETGVGKERLARAIHAESPRSAGPFVAVNCGALPESLLESELFGHEQGAFTGATRSRRGCFELAHRGTIFLDEISEMPFHLQVKLLRVLQEYEIQPVGAEKAIRIDVRIMASTNRNLDEEIQLKRFRQDLYYRLSVVSLTIPPLRERREDIPTLVESHVAFLRPRIGTGQYTVTPETMAALCRYSWPGNIRELINVVERAMLLCNREEITLDDLPESIADRGSGSSRERSDVSVAPVKVDDVKSLFEKPWRQVRQTLVGRLEKEYLKTLLKATHGHIGETAQRAGMQPRSLFDKMRKHGLHKEDFKA
ncbi:MAG: sigma-54-dependent Fis family transcriptional regulator [Sedimentisphaerales bacterium]|nr:sigma-54-dependent Fis family transcriptional regulator [Sedimentisphaerales bacterium]